MELFFQLAKTGRKKFGIDYGKMLRGEINV